MKTKIFLFTVITSLLVFASCNKNGCSNKNKQEHTYAVTDSTQSPPSMDWYSDSYQMIIYTCSKNETFLEIKNMGNNAFSILAELSSNDFSIPKQNYNENYQNITGSGTLEGDSIFFEINYLNYFGEPIAIVGFGVLE